jgi:hypothetical protein
LLTGPGDRAGFHRGNYKNKIKQPQNQEKPDKFERRKEVRKIFSILVTLGVILGMTLMAVPVAAAEPVCPTDCTPITIDDVISVGPPDFCAGGASNYLLGDPTFVTDITVPVTLTAGTDSLSVDFPAGTNLTAVVPAGVIVDSLAVGPFSPTAITVTGGTHLEFVVPVGFAPQIVAGTIITIQVNGVKNPPTAGKYCLFVDYKLACCAAVKFDCVEYTVVPAIMTLEFLFDFDATYSEIALGCIPPFKACGQVDYGTYIDPIGWFTDFNLILNDKVAGCAVPCASASMWFVVTKVPAGEEINFNFDGAGVVTYDEDDIGDVQSLPAVALVYPWVDIVFSNQIHFTSPGDYEICFYLQCPAVPCLAGSQIVAQTCLPAKVYQYKDAGKILLDEKWNLVSLPLVPFSTKISDLLACLDPEAKDGDGNADLIGIWGYDCTTEEFTSYPGPLADMYPGYSYWVRMTYPITASPAYTWWVWGTAKNMPPSMPLAYNLCEGWNNFGFTSLTDKDLDAYLWNFVAATPQPLVYGWENTGDWLTSNWEFHPFGNPNLDLISGQGYWGYFLNGGQIVP